MVLLECCLNNVSSDARDVLHDSDHHLRESICLDRCGDCIEQPFLVVDGEFRVGESHRGLLETAPEGGEGAEQ